MLRKKSQKNSTENSRLNETMYEELGGLTETSGSEMADIKGGSLAFHTKTITETSTVTTQYYQEGGQWNQMNQSTSSTGPDLNQAQDAQCQSLENHLEAQYDGLSAGVRHDVDSLIEQDVSNLQGQLNQTEHITSTSSTSSGPCMEIANNGQNMALYWSEETDTSTTTSAAQLLDHDGRLEFNIL